MNMSLKIAISVLAAFTGPLCGLFILAAFCPWANAKGAFTGTLVGLILMMWICLGSTFTGVVKPTPWLPPASTNQCMTATPPVASNTSTWTTFTPSVYNASVAETFREPIWIEEIYRLSYVWLGLLGITLTTLTGFTASWITGFNRDSPVDPRYLVPVFDRLCCCLPRSTRAFLSRRTNEESITRAENLAGPLLMTPTEGGHELPLSVRGSEELSPLQPCSGVETI